MWTQAPTIMSQKAAAGGMEVTLFLRLIEKWGNKVLCLRLVAQWAL